jgi:polysaccharide pyruvyl transferase WcaK-like protein
MKVLLVGYNGANNTGSEARLLRVIDDIRSVCGNDVEITVPSLNVSNLRRYLKEDEHLRIVGLPSIYHLTLRRLVRENDLMVLVEGSCYMDTWTSSLLGAYLWASRCAHRLGKGSIAYAVDAGEAKERNVRRIRKHASNTDMIIMRTYRAGQRMKDWGVKAPIEVTADVAFDFDLETAARPLRNDGTPGKVGLALVDFNLWPVVARPFGRKEHCYRWPYYFSRSKERCEASERLADGFARLADSLVKERGKDVVLISMEGVDEPLVLNVRKRMERPDRCTVLSSRELNSHQMTAGLRGLEALVTSRYHAAVLSMAASVPMMAIGHDRRLEDLYEEIGIKDRLFLPAGRDIDWNEVRRRLDHILDHGDEVREQVRKGFEGQMVRVFNNKTLLRKYLEGRGWCI